MNKKKGISLVVLLITIIVSLILISIALVTYKNNKTDIQAKQIKFKSEYDTLENELLTYMTNIKVDNPNKSIVINASGEELKNILPSLEKTDFETDTFIICNSVLAFKEDANLNENEKKWASEIAPILSTCEE